MIKEFRIRKSIGIFELIELKKYYEEELKKCPSTKDGQVPERNKMLSSQIFYIFHYLENIDLKNATKILNAKGEA